MVQLFGLSWFGNKQKWQQSLTNTAHPQHCTSAVPMSDFALCYLIPHQGCGAQCLAFRGNSNWETELILSLKLFVVVLQSFRNLENHANKIQSD